MRYRKLSPTGDYVFGSGELDFYRDVPAAVGQAVQTRLLLWLGEWFLDIEEGTLFMQGIFGKHSQETADATIQDRMAGTQGFVDIESYESLLDRDTRRLSVTSTINTIYGVTKVQVQNYGNY